MDDKEPVLPGSLYREYVEKALRDVQPFLSTQTGLLHLHRDLYEGLPVQAAPTYENFLYALLLFRRKTVESIQQGKRQLSRLLSFQQMDPSRDQYGSFPSILTEYPECRDWHLPISLCLVMSALRTSFESVLGDDLKARVHACHGMLTACAHNNALKSMTSGWASCVLALQEFLLHPPSKDSSPLRSFEAAARTFIEGREWLRPDAFGKVLAALSHLQCKDMALPTALLESARQMWHAGAGTYDGPALGSFQFGYVPAVTLFDCMMSVCWMAPMRNRPWPYLASLELALMTPPEEPCHPLSTRQEKPSGRPFMKRVVGSTTLSACLFAPTTSEVFGFHPIRIVTDHCTMVLHFPNGQLLELSQDGNRFVGRVKVNGLREENPSLMHAFVERSEDTQLLVDGKKATVFTPEKGIVVANKDVNISLSAQLPGCLGHVVLSNRPGQLLAKHKNGAIAYDWKLSMDFVRGEQPQSFEFLITV